MQQAPGGGGATGGWLQRAATTAAAASATALVAQVGAQAVKVEAETLQQFKNKVDALLQDLDGSVASQTNMSQQSLTPNQLGSNFGQASGLWDAYNQVHANLEQLSKTLSLQIQAMSMSIDVAAKGYQNTDDDEKSRFQSLLDQAGSAATTPLMGQMSPGAAGQGSYASPAAYGAQPSAPSAPSAPPTQGSTQGAY